MWQSCKIACDCCHRVVNPHLHSSPECQCSMDSMDCCTLSNYKQAAVTHIDITQLQVDFQKSCLKGTVTYTIKVLEGGTNQVILDTNGLNILEIFAAGNPLPFELDEERKPYGRALRIQLASEAQQGETVEITVRYRTSSESSALQWLPKEATHDKTHQYLFTQCQAIHARTMLPCQDTPAVKFTYKASVTVPEGMTALMSAIQLKRLLPQFGQTTFTFEQTVPIPSYLVALAVGRLESRSIGPRSKVWSEPGMVEAVAQEFSETEEFISAGEALVGPYVWQQYDILCLPPSFPYGGMENPCLTFVTPTLLAGDKSLADVVAHEISHSWSGNLVTNRTWEHFWLNEGFTVYLERCITAAVHGKDMFDFSALQGLLHLEDSVKHFQETGRMEFTKLVPDLTGIDPDEAFSSVPYEKGFNLLVHLESFVGRDRFVRFLRAYFAHFAHSTVTTSDFKSFFLQYFSEGQDGGKPVQISVDWDLWLQGEGMPPHNEFDKTKWNEVQDLAEAWLCGNSTIPSDSMSSFRGVHKIGFLDALLIALRKHEPAVIDPDLLRKMDSMYGFSQQGNNEILFRWFTLCIRCGVTEAVPHVITFLKSQGRMKYVRPLFRDLLRVEYGRSEAERLYHSHRRSYHPICAKMLTEDLENRLSTSPVDPRQAERFAPTQQTEEENDDAVLDEAFSAALNADTQASDVKVPQSPNGEESDEESFSGLGLPENAGNENDYSDEDQQDEGSDSDGDGEEDQFGEMDPTAALQQLLEQHASMQKSKAYDADESNVPDQADIEAAQRSLLSLGRQAKDNVQGQSNKRFTVSGSTAEWLTTGIAVGIVSVLALGAAVFIRKFA